MFNIEVGLTATKQGREVLTLARNDHQIELSKFIWDTWLLTSIAETVMFTPGARLGQQDF